MSKEMLDLYQKGIHTCEHFVANANTSDFIQFVLWKASSSLNLTQLVTIPIRCNMLLPISCAGINRFLSKQESFQPQKVWSKWTTQLDNIQIPLLWPNICKLRKDFVPVKLQTFHWKFINRALPYNGFLFKIITLSSPLCSFCKEQDETFIHLFWDCTLVKQLWDKLIQWCKIHVDADFNYSQSACLLVGDPNNPTLNNIFLRCKYFIHIQHCFKGQLHLKYCYNELKMLDLRIY